MKIQEWIEELESDDSLSIEEFYAKLLAAKAALEERLECASSDGVDLDMLDIDDEED